MAAAGIKTAPMEALLAEALPRGAGWQYEPKWDGFRCLAHKDGAAVDLRAKSGKSLNRFFPDVVERVKKLKTRRCVLDGEVLIVLEGAMAFDALQARLHPAASRVEQLAREQPALFMLFDCLAAGQVNLMDEPLSKRRAALERILANPPNGMSLSPYTCDLEQAEKWLARAGKALDGVVAKRRDGKYLSGERAMIKVKRTRSADCVVAGFRYATGSRIVGSLLLGLYDEGGLLHHVGFTSSLSVNERAALTKNLKPLIAKTSFTGHAPGESRWNAERAADWTPLKPKLVVEVRYDQVTDNRFRHGARLLRWRPDKSPRQCTFDQLKPSSPPAEIAQVLKQLKSR